MTNGYNQNPQDPYGYMNQQQGYGVSYTDAPYPYNQAAQPAQAAYPGYVDPAAQGQAYYDQSGYYAQGGQAAQAAQSAQATQAAQAVYYQEPQYQEPPQKPKPNKVAMVISYIISGAGSIVLFVSIFLFVAFMVPQLFGIRPYAVMTGSMEPSFPVGCLVYVQETNPGELEVNDVITFDRTTPGQSNSIITHRISQKDPTNREFVTKGDANEATDTQRVSYDSVIGKVVFAVPLVGYIAMAVDSWDGKVAMIAIIFGAMILCLVGDQIRRHAKKAARKKVAFEQPQYAG